jgi:peptide/nickel transport system permease protein
MLLYIVKRIVMMLPTIVVISIISFAVIQLPPGDFLSTMVTELRMQGEDVNEDLIRELEFRYGVGQPVYVQYWKWVRGIIFRGDFGQSFEWERPVKELIWERLGLTVVLSFSTLLFSWLVAIPVGVYSATHQYSILDYILNTISFVGRGIPGFFLALVVMWFSMRVLGMNVGGLFSEEYILAPWSWDKVVDLMKHIWIPMIILAVSSTAGLIRTTRANMLDEVRKPYVTTARAKGVKESKVIWKYPVRVALNPFFSTVGWALAGLVSSSTILSVVLNLQTTGRLMLRALQSQDMYLAGSFLLMTSILTVIGTLLSDILLAWVDPRIRMSG